jgi:low affinity Fe/Cu permease
VTHACTSRIGRNPYFPRDIVLGASPEQDRRYPRSMTDGAPHVAEEIDREPPKQFSIAARRMTEWTGSGIAAWVILAMAGGWLLAGPLSGYSRGWELVVTAGLPFLTLLMLAVIQHTQNHNDKALHLKLDELIRASNRASNKMMTVEEGSRHDLDRIQEAFQARAD